MTLTAQQLFDREFSRPRTERSEEFKAGVLALLRRRMDGAAADAPNICPRSARSQLFRWLDGAEIACPYTAGTAAFDAFYSGIEEGWRIYRNESDIDPERIEPKQQETRP
jgi:hypothetical protein